MRRVLLAAVVIAAGAAVAAGSAVAFQPGDPLASKQWYLDADRAFDAWDALPVLAPVRVAVIDSGIDLGHPEFRGRIAAARSFVGGTVQDTEGHGTFVAGEIAAALDNGRGIAGIAFPARLVVAKVLRKDGTIDPDEEARAIRWALARGARVINLSIGGIRDPLDGNVDTFSPAERDAVADAVRAGALVVSSVGNGDLAPREPWLYASYPAALPHVLGVAAYARDGSIPAFSNRDPRYTDVAAPGTEILSTIPRTLSRQGCADRGYSACGSATLREGGGTSFAAPQVTAAAALLFAADPRLRAEQVAAILERSATDLAPRGRDSQTGWGRLDVAAAIEVLERALPAADAREPNDAIGPGAAVLSGRSVDLHATLDRWDDPFDAYRVRVARGEWLYAGVTGLRGAQLSLWQPGRRLRSPAERLLYRAPATGWYDLKVFLSGPASGRYRLSVRRSSG
jgi:subtilisin family serine protease